MKDYLIDIGRLAVTKTGDGLPFVFTHGLTADNRQTLALGRGIQGLRLICPDMPGHGATPLSPASFRDFARLLLGLMDEQGIEKAIVGGISMGAGVALNLAIAAPHRVRGLVLVRPAWLNRPALPQLSIVRRIAVWQRERPRDTERLLIADAEFNFMRKTNPLAAQSLLGMLTRPQAEESASMVMAMIDDQPVASLEVLRVIQCPTLIVVNAGDPLHPMEIGETLAKYIANARLRHVPSRYLAPDDHAPMLQSHIANFAQHVGAS
jgi:pimeloyl-ACP methyl ester carboxylesterase